MLEWKKINDWPDYEISECGDIRRVNPLFIRKPYLTTTGYLYIVMRRADKKMAVAIHRLVAMTFIGKEPFYGAHVAHLDGNKTNNHWNNLSWVTRSQNERHKLIHGKSNRGERQGRSVLTQKDVHEIKSGISIGVRQADLAAKFGVSRNTISSISIGKSWAWLGVEA